VTKVLEPERRKGFPAPNRLRKTQSSQRRGARVCSCRWVVEGANQLSPALQRSDERKNESSPGATLLDMS
jgi:hypothetical protein